MTEMSIRHPYSILRTFSKFSKSMAWNRFLLYLESTHIEGITTYIGLCQTFDISNLLLSYYQAFSLNIKLLYKLFALLYTDYIIMQNPGHLYDNLLKKTKYASVTLCLQSIIISRISSTILELCSKNIMFAEHNNFKL